MNTNDNFESDQEQIKVIKDFFKEYGMYILLGILVFFIVSYGFNFYKNNINNKSYQASDIYSEMIIAKEQNKINEVNILAEQLIKNYSKTTYASFASFMLAKNAIESGDFNIAKEKLKWVIKNNNSEIIKDLAKKRLDRINTI